MSAAPTIQLKQVALEIANDILQSAVRLKPELQKMELRKMQIEAQLKSAHLCHERVRNFRAEIDGNLQCPSCWIRNEAEVALTPIPSNTKDDLFRCDRCGQTVEILIGA